MTGAEPRPAAAGVPVVIPAALAGERLDRVVAMLSGRPRGEVAELVAGGGVRVGGAVERRRARKLAEGEEVSFDLTAHPAPKQAAAPPPEGAVPFTVVFEDVDLVVVDKPAGVVTHPGAGQRTGTLVGGLLARYPELARLPEAGFGSAERPGIVHRLDKATSGLLAVARSERAFVSLSAQLAEHSVERTYRALVVGHVGPERGLVDAPIGRSLHDPTAMAVAAAGEGRAARTHYRVAARFDEPVPASELEVRLETGRTHQIRVHLSAIGHPVLGDRRYGGARSSAGVGRLMLHAEVLSLTHPGSGERRSFASPLPPDYRTSRDRFS